LACRAGNIDGVDSTRFDNRSFRLNIGATLYVLEAFEGLRTATLAGHRTACTKGARMPFVIRRHLFGLAGLPVTTPRPAGNLGLWITRSARQANSEHGAYLGSRLHVDRAAMPSTISRTMNMPKPRLVFERSTQTDPELPDIPLNLELEGSPSFDP
jgi:hypothetical protein